MEKPNKKLTPRRIVLLVLAAVVLALVIVAGRYLYVMFVDPMSVFQGSAQTPAPTESASTPAPVITPSPAAETNAPADTAAPAITPAPEETPLEPERTVTPEGYTGYMDGRVNILLLGWDQSPEREDETSDVYRDESNNFRSDVIMLMAVDFNHKTAELISVPRDSYAPLYNGSGERIAKKSHYKINAAFALGGSVAGSGFKYAMATVSKLLGVRIDHYAGVDMEGLKALVNAMGGVDYDVDVRITLNGRVLEKGYQHLDGQQVLDYCRARKGISTDVGRNDRQQRMLFAIFDKLRSSGKLTEMPGIVRSLKGYIYTDMDSEQIAALAALGMKLDMSDLSRQTLTGEYHSDTPYSNAGYYVLDNSALVELMYGTFGIVPSVEPRYDLSYVLGDIAADGAQAHILAADCLMEKAFGLTGGGALPRELVNSALLRERLRVLSTRAEDVSDAELDIPFDAGKIAEAQSALDAAAVELCARVGITRGSIPQNKLPDAIYDLIPEAQ